MLGDLMGDDLTPAATSVMGDRTRGSSLGEAGDSAYMQMDDADDGSTAGLGGGGGGGGGGTSAKQLELSQDQQPHKARVTEWTQTFPTLTADLIGVGVLSLPWAFAQLGWFAALALILLFCVGNTYTGLLINRLVLLRPAHLTTFDSLGRHCYGARGERVVRVLGYGFLATLVVADVLTATIALQEVADATGGELCRPHAGLIVLAAVLPALQLRSLHDLYWAAIGGLVCIAVPLLIVLTQVGEQDASQQSLDRQYPAQAIAHTPFVTFAGAAFSFVFAFTGQVLYVEFMAEMRAPADFRKVVWASNGTMLVVYTFVSALVYDLVGRDVLSPVTSNLPNGATKAVVNLLLFGHVYVANAINANVLIGAANKLLVPPKQQQSRAVWFGLSVVLAVGAYVVSNLFTFFGDLINVIGATFGMATTYMLPCAFALKALPLEPTERTGVSVLLALSVGVSIMGTYASLATLADDFSSFGPPFSC